MSVLKDSAVYLTGEILSKAIPFLLLPYLSRKLGVEGFGLLSLYQTYLALLGIVLGLSQDGAVARYFYFYGKRGVNLIVNAGYAYTLLLGGMALIGCWLIHSEIMAYLVMVAMFQCFLSVQLSILQFQKKSLSYSLLQLLLTSSSAIFTIVMLEYYRNDLVEKRILAILFSHITVFLFAYVFYTHRHPYTKRFTLFQYIKGGLYILSFGLPLLLHQTSTYLKGQLDRIFIYHQFSASELGLYAMGAQLAMILAVVIQAINKAMIPYLYERLRQEKITLENIYKWAILSLILVPIPAFVMWLIPESVVVWILGKQFEGTKHFIMLFLISTMLSIPYLILVNYLFYWGKNKLISFCSVLSVGFYLVSLRILITTQIQYVPFASIIASFSILPILYYATTKIRKE